MNLIVVYKGNDIIAANQLKKLIGSGNQSSSELSKDNLNMDIDIIPIEEKAYLANLKTEPFNDPILFINDVTGAEHIKPIAEPKSYGYGIICGFAGPQALLTVNPKKLKKAGDYNAFYEDLNKLTFQQISKAPKGIHEFIDNIAHGVLGAMARKENIKRQQLIYGVTKFYLQDLYDFLQNNRKDEY